MDEKSRKAFAEGIRKYRVLLNKTQEQLAYEAGISTNYLSTIETGFFNPSALTIIALLNALNISYDDCMRGNLSRENLTYNNIMAKYHSLSSNGKEVISEIAVAINKRK